MLINQMFVHDPSFSRAGWKSMMLSDPDPNLKNENIWGLINADPAKFRIREEKGENSNISLSFIL